MDNKTEKTKSKTFLFVLVAVSIIGCAFYWLEIRPTNIRKKCSWEAMERSVKLYPYSSWPDTTKRTELQEALETKLYDSCLSERGLK